MNEVVDALISARLSYKGTGLPTMYTSESLVTRMLLARDNDGRRQYRTMAELASELRVAAIIPVEILDRQSDVLAVIVNLADYTLGADRGGEVTLFDDFDIDYNQYKYLIETRVSGALTKYKSAMCVRSVAANKVLAVATKPAFDPATNTITMPTVTGVQYKINGVNKAAGSTTVINSNTVVDAVATGNYYLATSDQHWGFTPSS
jgi:hypothetical protein